MPDEPKPPERPAEDKLSVTQHSIRIGAEEIRYTVTCGTVVLKEETEKDGASEGEKPKATVFFVAYAKDDVADKSLRPITFSFNGGPGSSSVWLHLGLLGPRRVAMGDVGALTPPPYGLTENESSLLDVSDIVFIDPVSTGYSRVVPGEKAKEFHGFKKDIESVGDFIRLYTSRNGRWSSPKFLIGESYGTTRAGGLSGYLQERHGMFLNGIMLVSSILDFGTADAGPGNDLPYILHLPTYAATAWYHQKLPTDLQKKPLQAVLDAAEAFALGEYAKALMMGSGLPPTRHKTVARKLSRLTGLSVDYLEGINLRPEIMRFTKELLRHERKTVGRLDSRFTGTDRDTGGEHFEYDPSYAAILGPYTAGFNQYVREELKFESDLPYEIITPKVRPWSYKEFENAYVSVSDTLRKAISMNPYLKVYVGSGYFDLATPYFATDYTCKHLGLEPELRPNVQIHYYQAGHMMYVHLPSLSQQAAHLRAFIRDAVPQPPQKPVRKGSRKSR